MEDKLMGKQIDGGKSDGWRTKVMEDETDGGPKWWEDQPDGGPSITFSSIYQIFLQQFANPSTFPPSNEENKKKILHQNDLHHNKRGKGLLLLSVIINRHFHFRCNVFEKASSSTKNGIIMKNSTVRTTVLITEVHTGILSFSAHLKNPQYST